MQNQVEVRAGKVLADLHHGLHVLKRDGGDGSRITEPIRVIEDRRAFGQLVQLDEVLPAYAVPVGEAVGEPVFRLAQLDQKLAPGWHLSRRFPRWRCGLGWGA